MNSKIKVLFLATPDIAEKVLIDLINSEKYQICGVVTNPDKQMGRGLELKETVIKKIAVANSVPCFTPEDLSDKNFIEQIQQINPDVGLVFAFKKLPPTLYKLPKHGTFNIHTSLLPNYRGAAPINWAIINGEKETGLTTFMLNDKIDTGDIVNQIKIKITENMNAGELYEEMKNKSVEIATNTLGKICFQKANFIKQDDTEDKIKKAPKIFKIDFQIDWDKYALEVNNRIRGLNPFPGCTAEVKYKNHVWQISIMSSKHIDSIEENANDEIGHIEIVDKKRLCVKCKVGKVEILKLKIPNRKAINAVDFINESTSKGFFSKFD